MWIGSCRNDTAAPLGLTWVNTVKALGIVFTYNEIERLQKNVYDKLKDIRLQIRLWRWRGLSLLGKITIIKSFLISKMTYVFSFYQLRKSLQNNLTLLHIIFCVLLPFFFGKTLKTSGLYFQVKEKNLRYKMYISVN